MKGRKQLTPHTRFFLWPPQAKLGLIFIPLILPVAGWLYIQSSGLYFLRCVDPEYGYLLNGVLIACGKPDVQFITNPGIPVHFLVAMVSSVVHLFRPGQPLIDDVLTHPELYLRASLYAINLLNAIALFFLGYAAYRYTKQIVVSLFLQLLYFTHLLTLESLARLMPESLMGIIICCWLIMLLKLLYTRDQSGGYHRNGLFFGLLFAIGVANKLTFLPFLILPFMLLPGWKNKLIFAGYALLFFVVVAYPVTLDHKFFTRWISDMFVHTGTYGSGDTGFIKWNEFSDHLSLLINHTSILVWSLVSLALSTLLYLLRRSNITHNNLQLRMNLGLIVLVVLQYFMASKHFAYHYMNPSLLLTIFVVFMTAETLRSVFQRVNNTMVNVFLGIAALLIMLYTIPAMTSQLKQMQSASALKYSAWQRLEPVLEKKPLIVSTSYYGCSAREYALTYGIQVSGRHGDFLTERFKKHYPETYLYFPWGKAFYEGRKELDPASFVNPDLTYTLYIADYCPEKLDGILSRVKSSVISYEVVVEELIQLPETAESVYSLRFASRTPADTLSQKVPQKILQ